MHSSAGLSAMPCGRGVQLGPAVRGGKIFRGAGEHRPSLSQLAGKPQHNVYSFGLKICPLCVGWGAGEGGEGPKS